LREEAESVSKRRPPRALRGARLLHAQGLAA
jgi:hypothetical protein